MGCRWVFIVKYKFDGFVERYKGRLVEKDYKVYGLIFFLRLGLITKINAIRVLLPLATNMD